LKSQLQLYEQEEKEEEEITFIIDTIDDKSLQQDYIAFPESFAFSESNKNSSSENSSISSLEKSDYSL